MLSSYEDLSDWSLKLAGIQISTVEKHRTTLLSMAEMIWELGTPLEVEEPVVEEVALSVRTQSKGKGHKSKVVKELEEEYYNLPVLHIVPKPNSSDFQMVTDHSFGLYALNAMISHNDVTSYPLDNLKHLGEVLLNFHQTTKPVEPLVLFKSDISEVYRLLLVHKKSNKHMLADQVVLLNLWSELGIPFKAALTIFILKSPAKTDQMQRFGSTTSFVTIFIGHVNISDTLQVSIYCIL